MSPSPESSGIEIIKIPSLRRDLQTSFFDHESGNCAHFLLSLFRFAIVSDCMNSYLGISVKVNYELQVAAAGFCWLHALDYVDDEWVGVSYSVVGNCFLIFFASCVGCFRLIQLCHC